MKKLTNLLFIIIILLVLTSCNYDTSTQEKTPETDLNEKTPTQVEPKESMITETLDSIKINNNVFTMEIDSDSGSFISLVNNETGRDFLSGYGSNWSFLIDLTTSDYYQSNSKRAITINSNDYTPIIKVLDNEMNVVINYKYNVTFENGGNEYSGIVVNQYITINKNDGEILVDYSVENNLNTDSVIITFDSVVLTGIKDEKKSLDLFWAFREGMIQEDIITKDVSTSKQYPSQYSMQLMQLFDEEDSLYYYIKDNTREYKVFNYGKDSKNLKLDSMYCTQYPFISSGEAKNLWSTVIGIDSYNEWYSGSDSYRNYLIEQEMDRDYNDYVSEWTGFTGSFVAEFNDKLVIPYVGAGSPDKTIYNQDSYGIDTIVLIGWHEGGFDSMYPDYNFIEGSGYGEENFKKMVENAHANGDKIIPYLNAHITATNSIWGQQINSLGIKNIDSTAIKKEGFTVSTSNYANYMYKESYGTSISYYATCPNSQAFLEQLEVVVERLASCGVDGLWMDQMMEMPAYLCYDPTHDHKTPATAYGEGYKKMYEMIDATFAKYNIEHLIFAEGTTDAWIEYIDICGLMWGRPFYAEGQDPNTAIYTIPAKFLGIDSANTLYANAHAFLYGLPFKEVSSTSAKVIKLFEENMDIYMYGRFMDTLGIEYQNKNVLAGVIKGEGNSVGIQLYNNSSSAQTVFLEIELEELGIDGEITSVVNMFDNSVVEVKNNKVTIKMTAEGMVALRVTYEEV